MVDLQAQRRVRSLWPNFHRTSGLLISKEFLLLLFIAIIKLYSKIIVSNCC